VVQRYRCLRCGKSFSEKHPLDGLRVDFTQAIQVVNLLCEGMGIRPISRITSLHRDTVLAILEMAGNKCQMFLDARVQNVKAEHIQVDEMHTFVYSKQQNTEAGDEEHGEFFTYLSVDRASKLIINWLTGKRNRLNTNYFLNDLKIRVPERFQLTTDAYHGYCGQDGSVRRIFREEIDYATERKVFGKMYPDSGRRFNPLTVIGIRRKPRIGMPDMDMATTCHAERTNLSVRTFTRRFTRCTIGYSKKLDNLRHAVALFVCHFNFCRKHSAHNKTPAAAANLTDKAWTIEEILKSQS
jgi:IS1 family transposase